jgi:hypothetical protein
MIFQNFDGSILIINKSDCKNDYIYYKKIYDIIKSMSSVSKDSIK